jgi:hypothetical protein
LERQGNEGKLVNANQLCQDIDSEFERIRKFLEARLASLPAAVS